MYSVFLGRSYPRLVYYSARVRVCVCVWKKRKYWNVNKRAVNRFSACNCSNRFVFVIFSLSIAACSTCSARTQSIRIDSTSNNMFRRRRPVRQLLNIRTYSYCSKTVTNDIFPCGVLRHLVVVVFLKGTSATVLYHRKSDTIPSPPLGLR